MSCKRFAALLTSVLTVPALLAVLGLPSARALKLEGDLSAPHEGYLVKLTPEAAVSVLSDGDGEPDPLPYLALDSLEEALELPEALVEYIEPNYLVELLDLPEDEGTAGETPGEEPAVGFNDPLYQEYQWNFQEIHVYDAWRQGLTGRDVKVGFVDSGVNRSHEDLDPERIDGVNLAEDGLTFDQDSVGHGTFTAGLLAAQSDNGLGLAGVAPEARIMAYRAFNSKYSNVRLIIEGLKQAVNDGCQIVNMSLGLPFGSSSQLMQESVEYALNSGVIVIAAVGNSASAALQYPAAFPGVIGVGSVDRDLTRSSFSHYNESVDFVTFANGVAGLSGTANDGYETDASNRGTSYAAPVISGLAALALGYDPDITPEQIFTLLYLSSTDLGDPGYDTSFGFGLPDAGRMAELLTAEWTAALHPGEGGVLPAGVSALCTYRAYTGLRLPIPARPGYRFTGWYEDQACQGTPLTELPAGETGDRTLYAGWAEDPRAPRTCWRADYDSQGRMTALERLEPERWEEARSSSGGASASEKVFWLDGGWRPAAQTD